VTIVMRFSPRAFQIVDEADEHRRKCSLCAKAGHGNPEQILAMRESGCLTGVLLAEEFRAEYERLHGEDEKAALDGMGEDVARAIVDAIPAEPARSTSEPAPQNPPPSPTGDAE
jgi:hypothetical protein